MWNTTKIAISPPNEKGKKKKKITGYHPLVSKILKCLQRTEILGRKLAAIAILWKAFWQQVGPVFCTFLGLARRGDRPLRDSGHSLCFVIKTPYQPWQIQLLLLRMFFGSFFVPRGKPARDRDLETWTTLITSDPSLALDACAFVYAHSMAVYSGI